MSRARDLDGLPARITLVRTHLGLAQGSFAARVGVTRNIVIRWERGHHRPRADALERIAAVGGVSVDWLLSGNGRRPPARRDPPRNVRSRMFEPPTDPSCRSFPRTVSSSAQRNTVFRST